jgi:pyruvate, water dikinase
VTHTRPLHELRRADEPLFGGKSASLGELLDAGIPVPPGFALATSAYEELARGLPERSDETIRSAAVPESVREEVVARYEQLALTAHQTDPPVAVRSSAVGEDSEEATFAGQQETYLWVRGADRVCDAVRDCWASLYSAPAVSYRARLGRAGQGPAMGVAVQVMVDAAVSGVLFTCNPVSGDPSMVAVNASWGLGLAVVGGEVTPDDFLVSKITGEVVRQQIHDKELEYLPDPDGSGPMRVDVPEERRARACLDPSQLEALLELARRVERHFGSHQDVEWAIARESAELFVLQSRPVTAVAKREKQAEPKSAIAAVMSTFGVRSGDGAE